MKAFIVAFFMMAGGTAWAADSGEVSRRNDALVVIASTLFFTAAAVIGIRVWKGRDPKPKPEPLKETAEYPFQTGISRPSLVKAGYGRLYSGSLPQ